MTTTTPRPTTNASLVTHVRLADGKRAEVSIVDGRIAALGAALPCEPGVPVEDGGDALLLPVSSKGIRIWTRPTGACAGIATKSGRS
ncbi:hypothetical protein HDG34_007252 [Paraburkholderia sp. HC6.4b]|nr:hypothetical protein [Paraburkholderia sp. HC6.4b]MBB5455555.1 hypothetical protein [Paraburkholderia sp. Kb1A]